jgi:hypothetical protein
MLAEAVRFELTIGLLRCRFSRPVHSTALPRFRGPILGARIVPIPSSGDKQ